MTAELIYAKMAAVIKDTEAVDKSGYNQTQKFYFRSIDDTVGAVRKALIKNVELRLTPQPVKVAPRDERGR